MIVCKWLCNRCKGTEIRVTAWVLPNRNFELVDGDPPTDQIWCDTCESETSVTFQEVES
jgi:hypothetical protein